MATLVLWLLVVVFVGVFAAQVATRVRLIAAAPNTFALDQLGFRIQRFLVDVVLQRQTIAERPVAGVAHALVFWGFIAFGGYTIAEFLNGLGIVDLTHGGWFERYRSVLAVFAAGVLAGILYLLVRRAFVRPVALGARVSVESLVIGLFIVTLMTTFLLTLSVAGKQHGRPGQLVGARRRDSRVPRADSLVEALPPRALADHGVSALAGSRERAESRFREGRGRSRDRQGSRQQDRSSTRSPASSAGAAR